MHKPRFFPPGQNLPSSIAGPCEWSSCHCSKQSFKVLAGQRQAPPPAWAPQAPQHSSLHSVLPWRPLQVSSPGRAAGGRLQHLPPPCGQGLHGLAAPQTPCLPGGSGGRAAVVSVGVAGGGRVAVVSVGVAGLGEHCSKCWGSGGLRAGSCNIRLVSLPSGAHPVDWKAVR